MHALYSIRIAPFRKMITLFCSLFILEILKNNKVSSGLMVDVFLPWAHDILSINITLTNYL